MAFPIKCEEMDVMDKQSHVLLCPILSAELKVENEASARPMNLSRIYSNVEEEKELIMIRTKLMKFRNKIIKTKVSEIFIYSGISALHAFVSFVPISATMVGVPLLSRRPIYLPCEGYLNLNYHIFFTLIFVIIKKLIIYQQMYHLE
jgi:hypothetical protein